MSIYDTLFGSLHPLTLNSYYLALQVCSGRALLEYQSVFNRNAYMWNTRDERLIQQKIANLMANVKEKT